MCSGMCTRTLERVEGKKEEKRGERTQERSNREGMNHTDVGAQSLTCGLGSPFSSCIFSFMASFFLLVLSNDTSDYAAMRSGALRGTTMYLRWDGS